MDDGFTSAPKKTLRRGKSVPILTQIDTDQFKNVNVTKTDKIPSSASAPWLKSYSFEHIDNVLDSHRDAVVSNLDNDVLFDHEQATDAIFKTFSKAISSNNTEALQKYSSMITIEVGLVDNESGETGSVVKQMVEHFSDALRSPPALPRAKQIQIYRKSTAIVDIAKQWELLSESSQDDSRTSGEESSFHEGFSYLKVQDPMSTSHSPKKHSSSKELKPVIEVSSRSHTPPQKEGKRRELKRALSLGKKSQKTEKIGSDEMKIKKLDGRHTMQVSVSDQTLAKARKELKTHTDTPQQARKESKDRLNTSSSSSSTSSSSKVQSKKKSKDKLKSSNEPEAPPGEVKSIFSKALNELLSTVPRVKSHKISSHHGSSGSAPVPPPPPQPRSPRKPNRPPPLIPSSLTRTSPSNEKTQATHIASIDKKKSNESLRAKFAVDPDEPTKRTDLSVSASATLFPSTTPTLNRAPKFRNHSSPPGSINKSNTKKKLVSTPEDMTTTTTTMMTAENDSITDNSHVTIGLSSSSPTSLNQDKYSKTMIKLSNITVQPGKNLVQTPRGTSLTKSGKTTSSSSSKNSSHSLLGDALVKGLVYENPTSSNFSTSGLSGATPKSLLALILDHYVTFQDSQKAFIVRSFLITHKQFMSSVELLRLMIEIYKGADGVGEDGKMQYDLQMRVVQLVCKWLSLSILDFYEDRILQLLNNWIDSLRNGAVIQKAWAALISNAYENSCLVLTKNSTAVSGGTQDKFYRKMFKFPVEGSIQKSVYQSLSMLQFSTDELAQQMTLLDHYYLSSVAITEYLNKNFMNESHCPNLTLLNNHYNRISKWICTEVATTPNIRNRIKTLSHCIDLAEKLKRLQNWNGFMAVLSGLLQFPLARMKNTWKNIQGQLLNKWRECERFGSPLSNFRHIRETYNEAKPPHVPPVSIILKDLTFAEEGNKDWLDQDKKLINYHKVEVLGRILTKIQEARNVRYPFPQIDLLRGYLENVFYLDNMDDLEIQSKTIEPSIDV
eukprot:TRINITY_DN352_c7_g1_i1.p1 TRINITY_DN352_c7_g1~~TRINITY_DN352_c7_g1_i1.p1  ORF type:complete len:1045 (-),score=221.73 TRINITY_DN352_c7_g1_i1:27-3047(-)